jgi:hypothetical protein
MRTIARLSSDCACCHAIRWRIHNVWSSRHRTQLQEILETTPPGPTIISGDFNTTTFARGNLQRTLAAFATLALLPQPWLRRRLQQPDQPWPTPREPLFVTLQRQGFEWQQCNDRRETLDLLLKDVQEAQELPDVLRACARPVLAHVQRRTKHRLDWIAARDLQPFPRSAKTGVQWMRGDRPASDHAPIACHFKVQAPSPR